jgi:hypothetical protein
MPLSRRYSPEHPSSEECSFGMDFSAIIPVGVGIIGGAISIWRNTAPPTQADTEWTFVTPVTVRGRVVYCTLTGGIEGVDYQLVWTVNDTQGNTWQRTALCLCAQTS